MTAAARDWYQCHQSMKPLEKLQHEVKMSQELLKKKWARLEKRVSNMLLQSIPESQKEEVISTKNLSVLGILTRLMINYQPGGSHEKAAVLAALESPPEATTVGEAISGPSHRHQCQHARSYSHVTRIGPFGQQSPCQPSQPPIPSEPHSNSPHGRCCSNYEGH